MATTLNRSDLLAGARNCVIDCAQITKGSAVTIVSESGTDKAVVDAIAETAREAGAKVDIVWAEPYAKGGKIPDEVFKAFRDADILINQYHSLSRAALADNFPDEMRVRVPNRAITAELLASPWARFPYQLQKIVADVLEETMAPGRTWRITSPAGTDLSGRFAAPDSEVARAYFQTDEDNNRARRNFPGGVHGPRVSDSVNGTIVAEYVDGAPPEMQPVRLTIHDGKVTAVEGGDAAGRAIARVQESDGSVDSWHCGVNPKVVVPEQRLKAPRKWYSYAHCSPRMVHFHLGRTHDTINVGSLDQTLAIEGRTLYRDGVLCDLSDKRIAGAMQRYGVGADAFRTNPLPF